MKKRAKNITSEVTNFFCAVINRTNTNRQFLALLALTAIVSIVPVVIS